MLIKNSEKKFNDLKTFPSRSPEQILLFKKMHKIEYVDPLNFIDYNPISAKSELIDTIGWREYSGKHIMNQYGQDFIKAIFYR